MTPTHRPNNPVRSRLQSWADSFWKGARSASSLGLPLNALPPSSAPVYPPCRQSFSSSCPGYFGSARRWTARATFDRWAGIPTRPYSHILDAALARMMITERSSRLKACPPCSHISPETQRRESSLLLATCIMNARMFHLHQTE